MSTADEFRRKKRATIIDVGHAAGVSDATVSRALNRPETVSEATRQKVQQAIVATGYVPNALAKAMVSGRSQTIGALIPTLDHAIFSKFLHTLESELSAQGFNLVVAVTNGNRDYEVSKAKKMLAMGVEGLIVSGLSHNDELTSEARRYGVPLVLTSYYQPDHAFPTIGYDNAKASALALDHLVAHGHCKIAVVHGPLIGNDRTRSRIAGLQEHPAAAGLNLIETDLSYAGGAAAIDRLTPGETAVLCLSDVLAMGALFVCQSRGIAVPQDLSIMGFDDLDPSKFVTPSLTTLSLPIAQMGQHTAAAMADHLMTGRPIRSIELPVKLQARASVAHRQS